MSSKIITVRVPETLHQQLHAEAHLEGESGSQFIREAILARLLYLQITREGRTDWQRLTAVAAALEKRLVSGAR